MNAIEIFENKKKWAAKCSVVGISIPIFMQAAWLNAVCAHPDNWQVLLETDEKEEIVAALIIHLENKKFYTRLGAPHLTPHAGIWFAKSDFKKLYENYHFIKKINSALIEKIPPSTFSEIRLLPENKDGQPFYWKGYSIGIRYTYQLDLLDEKMLLLKGMNDNTRRNIKKGDAVYNVSTNLSIDIFTELLNATFNRQDKKNTVPKSVWERLERSDVIKSNRLMLFAIDKNSITPEAAVYIAYDTQTAYYVAGGCTATGRKNGALYFLLWRAICSVPTTINTFDFEGSMLENVEPVFRGFGAKQTPYLVVKKVKNTFWSALESVSRS